MESFVPLCSVGLVFCFMMCSHAPATPTTNKMSSAERTPPISGKQAVCGGKKDRIRQKQVSKSEFL